jgi:hypothetical protein
MSKGKQLPAQASARPSCHIQKTVGLIKKKASSEMLLEGVKQSSLPKMRTRAFQCEEYLVENGIHSDAWSSRCDSFQQFRRHGGLCFKSCDVQGYVALQK